MKGWRLRIHGSAELLFDDPLTAQFSCAQFVVRVTPDEVFGNCPRYIHKYRLVERSSYIPRRGATVPIPDWKKLPDMNAVLPRNDPARES
jgi:hypothetical protein